MTYPENKLTCDVCGETTVPILYENGPHIGATCSNCNSFIKWVPQNRKWRAQLVLQNKR